MPTPARPYQQSYICTKCGVEKPREEYYKRNNRKSGCWSECKTCFVERQMKRYHENPDLINDQRAASKYGTTLEHIQQLREDAQGICSCCGREGLHHHKRLVIDHDHATGKVRGLICSKCNTVLGLCGDNIGTLKNLIEYLEGE